MPEAPAFQPPDLDPQAARRWAALPRSQSPWLHEEVARRMAQRLQDIRLPVQRWACWEPLRSGVQGQALVAAHYPQAQALSVRHAEGQPPQALPPAAPWWRRWPGQAAAPAPLAEGSVQLLWANMLAHHSPDPSALLTEWRRALAVDGFLMFSTLGPDSLRELRDLYARQGWPAPAHGLTDMHDWGDALLAHGFAEPVMDMERITLRFASPERLLQELRELGRNLSRARFAGLRGRRWRADLLAALQAARPPGQADFSLTFELIYGHALKPAPRHAVAAHTRISLDDMRQSLRQPPHRF